jgi:ABC-2 type transport system permease protein
VNGSLMRAWTMVLRYTYLLRSSWPRILELAYWPTVQMILWGLITQFFVGHSEWVAQAAGVLLAAVLLWDVLFRAQLGVTLPFFEELYSRNLGHLFVSPLRPIELVISLLGISLIRTLIGVGTAVLLAIPLYEFSLFSLGLPLLAFFTNLMVLGCALGLMIAALVLRYGLGAESLAWVGVFALAPISGIYYPIETLPGWLQPIALALPSAHVFEGMRAVMFEHRFAVDLFGYAVALNAVYMGLAVWLFLTLFQHARRDGQLLNVGE